MGYRIFLFGHVHSTVRFYFARLKTGKRALVLYPDLLRIPIYENLIFTISVLYLAFDRSY